MLRKITLNILKMLQLVYGGGVFRISGVYRRFEKWTGEPCSTYYFQIISITTLQREKRKFRFVRDFQNTENFTQLFVMFMTYNHIKFACLNSVVNDINWNLNTRVGYKVVATLL